MSDQTCGNCKWAQFTLTPSGKFEKGRHGTCDYPIPEMPVLPISLTKAYWFNWFTDCSKSAIWPEYTDCPTWEAKVDT